MVGHRLRRRPNIAATWGQHVVFAGMVLRNFLATLIVFILHNYNPLISRATNKKNVFVRFWNTLKRLNQAKIGD